MRKKIEQIKLTPELILHYKQVGEFLRAHPEIKSRKLKVGYEVNIGSISDHLDEEWLEICTSKY